MLVIRAGNFKIHESDDLGESYLCHWKVVLSFSFAEEIQACSSWENVLTLHSGFGYLWLYFMLSNLFYVGPHKLHVI
jgi:hypothetical protein